MACWLFVFAVFSSWQRSVVVAVHFSSAVFVDVQVEQVGHLVVCRLPIANFFLKFDFLIFASTQVGELSTC